MKKVLLALFATFGLMTSVHAEIVLPEKRDVEPIKLYLFYADYCNHCHDFIQFFVNNYKEEYKDYFEIVTLEADIQREKGAPRPDNIEANNKIGLQLRDYFEIDTKDFGWPFVVVGDYSHCGYGSTTGEVVIKKALEQYQKEDYKDIVATFIEEEPNASVRDLKAAASVAGIPYIEDENEESSIVLISVILIVVFGGLVGLVYLAKKN